MIGIDSRERGHFSVRHLDSITLTWLFDLVLANASVTGFPTMVGSQPHANWECRVFAAY
jgi:hypothetical protein